MFELLVSADAVVPDHDGAVAVCQREWGLPAVHPNWTSAPPGAGAKWSFARLQRDRRAAPTALEILGIPYGDVDPLHRPEGYAYLPEIAAAQGQRPARNHSTVVSSSDVAGVADRLTASGGSFRLDPPDAVLPFPRLWVGFSPEHPGDYDPSTDGGLRLEVIPHDPLRMPAPDPAGAPSAPVEGGPIRVVARTILVRDLDAVCATLVRHLGWEPAATVRTTDGVRRARFGFAYPGSATLELCEPDGDATVEGQFLSAWGPGPFSARIAVADLAGLERRLAAESVPHRRLASAGAGIGERVFRPADRRIGTAFEFVESAGTER